MSEVLWQVPNDIRDFVNNIKDLNHPHLIQATFAIGFTDSKIFKKGKFNWGKVSKFSKLNKLWHPKDLKYDFSIMLCADAWYKFLTAQQREAWVDLNLSRCKVEYEPVMVEENGKKKPVKDEWGRVEYTNKVKTDDEGNSIWKTSPLDIEVFSQNIKRYGLWCEDLVNLKHAIEKNA